MEKTVSEMLDESEELLFSLWQDLGEDTFQVVGFIVQRIHHSEEMEWDFESIKLDLECFLDKVEEDFSSPI